MVSAMSGTPSGWAPLLLTTLGGGVLGSVVATYGAQARDRRQARAQAREAMRRAEKVAMTGTGEELDAALEDLETSAMLARLPKNLIDLYSEARRYAAHFSRTIDIGDINKTKPEEIAEETKRQMVDEAKRQMARMTSANIAGEAARLFASATWHPWYGAPRRWHRVRRLRFALAGNGPQFRIAPEAKRMLRQWEREDIRRGKRFLRKR
jgi:hypothetical protein